MKVNVEKGLHETAQELEKLAWLCSNSGTCPTLTVLNDALRHSAWLMRLARAGLAVRANRIKELEEALEGVLFWAGPIAGDTQFPEEGRLEEESVNRATKVLGK